MADYKKNGSKGGNGKREYGDKKPYGKRDYGEGKREYGDKKPYGKREYGEGKREYGDKKPYGKREYGDKKPYGRNDYSEREHERRYADTDRRESEQTAREDELPFIIMGRNAVREAIKSGRSIDKILVVPERDGSLGEIVSMAYEHKILVQEEKRERLDEICMPFGHGEKTGNHQGIIARVPGAEYVEIEDILAYAEERGEKPFVLLLDGITDPYNFGSIIRSAECAGVHGIIIPKRRSVSLTSAVMKVSAGAASHMRVAKVPNIAGAIDKLRDAGLWIAGTDMDGQSMYETDMKGAIALVIGSEDEGLSALVRKKCDYVVAAPIKGHIDSLNAAVACAVVMFEKVRQDASAN